MPHWKWFRASRIPAAQADVTLYTGNDDNIVIDLLTPFRVTDSRGKRQELEDSRRVAGPLGGLDGLGRQAVPAAAATGGFPGTAITPDILTLAQEVTDMNSAVFDSPNNFAGCIPGIQEVLRRQGLLASRRCLNPDEVLSPGQAGELDRVCRSYPHLIDDDFIRSRIQEWQ